MKRLLSILLFSLSAAALASTTVPPSLIKPTGSTAGQAIVSTGPSSSPAWGAVPVGGISPISANSVLANGTGSSATPTAFAMPSCSTSTSALQWTTNTGFTCFSGSAPLVSPTFTGTVTIPGGTINNTVIGGTTPSAGTFTSLNSTSGSINANLGSTTPGTGAFTTISATGLITPSSTAGIKGTVAADNANAGSIGEIRAATAGPLGLSAGVTTNIVSDNLPAGDWDVQCTIDTVPAGSTTTSNVVVGVSTTSGAFGPLGASTQLPYAAPAGSAVLAPTPVTRINISSTTTTYCVANINFSVSTLSINAIIRARRVR